MNKKNKSIIGLVVLILLFIGGIIGKRINEENAVIKKAEVAINNGDYDNARDILYTVVDGNNKKIDKLWNVVVSYQKAQSSGVDSGLKYLNEIDSSYKKYDRLKDDVDNLKKELLNVKKIRKEFLVKIEEVKSLIEKGEYEQAEELSKETSEWQYIEQADINTMYDLHVKASELLSNQRKDNLSTRVKAINDDIEKLKLREQELKQDVDLAEGEPVSYELVRDVMTRFKEVFLSMGTSQQRKQLIHLLISKITMNKEREIDSIEIQINNDVITYLKKDGLPNKHGNPSFLHLFGMNCVNFKIVI